MTKEEKFDKAIEWLEGAMYNCDKVQRVPFMGEIIKNQIENSIKYLKNEEVDDDVFGAN